MAAHELLLGTFMVLVPQQFNSPVYAGLAPSFQTYAALLLLGGVLLVLAALGVGPPATRAAMVVLAAGPLVVLALRFLSLGLMVAVAIYGLEAIAALAAAASPVVPRLRRLRLLPLLCGLVAAALGALLVVSPGSFIPTGYGFITLAPFPLGLSFVGSGALLLLVEARRTTSLAAPAGALGGTSFALIAVSTTIAHAWTGTVAYGLLATALFLSLAQPLRLRHMAVLLGVAAAAVAGFDLQTWISPLDALRPASNTLRAIPAIAILLVCAGQVAAQTEVRGGVRLASGAGMAAVLAGLGCAGYAALYAGTFLRLGQLIGPGAGGPMDLYVGVGLQIALAGVLLYASANAPVGRWTPHLIAVLAGVGLVGAGAVNLLAYGLGTADLLEALGPLAMRANAALALLFVGVAFIIPTLPRIARGPIAGRVFTGLAMIALLILLRSFITESASRDAISLAQSDSGAAGRLLDAATAAGNGLVLLIGAAMIATGLVLTRTVTRPVEDLRRALTRFAAGERAARAAVIQEDEIGELGAAFNAMATELGALHDDLERRVERRTAELSAANQELESFAYAVSHDLRAPLRSIEGFSGAILGDEQTVLGERSRSDFQRVQGAARRMAEIIDELLTLSRLTREEMHVSRVDLSALATAEVAALRDTEPRDIEVAIVPGVVARADPQLIRHVLANLLSNAWKFTRTTSRAKIEFWVEDGAAGRVYAVRDNGVGFDMAYAGKLFTPFQRLHSTRDFEGNGIGLATVQRIVLRHGGRVWADAVPGRGATFRFTFGTDH